MAQIFGPGMNTVAKASIVAGALVAGGLLTVVLAIERSPLVNRQGQIYEQPVPFSHDHHVGEIGIDCRYCHTSVETSSSAGIPPTSTCMNCHSVLFNDADMLEPVRASYRTGEPLRWNRVYDLPDYVYFDHSIHIAKGIGCDSCHGRIDKQPLTQRVATLQMSFCLECHRDPAANVRPREEVFNLAWQPGPDAEEMRARLAEDYHVQSKMSCSTCHR